MLDFAVSREKLVEHALKHEKVAITVDGALVANTGSRTGRSVKDRYIVVDNATRDSIAWGKNSQPYPLHRMERVWQKVLAYQKFNRCFADFFQIGASDTHALKVKVITEYAWHNLFLKNLFITEVGCDFADCMNWTLISLPGLKLDPNEDAVHSDAALFIDFSKKCVVSCGLLYAGEMKKAMFSVMNYLLPVRDVLPMHCAANMGPEGDTALFFGLSGTGKTSLSADASRHLIGDDEHGWSREGVFNFEGGCYAKCINLSEQHEPLIWNATKHHTSVLENVVLNDGIPDFLDASLTANTRAAYSRKVIANCVGSNRGGGPKAVIFLTCDLYGVIPPVSVLTLEQAVFWFLNGYTALVGSTEVGSAKEIQPTFSTCFGAAFFPRSPEVYATLLKRRIEEDGAKVYLVNTGWTGGAHGVGGSRFPIGVTRDIIARILDDSVIHAERQVVTAFGLSVPKSLYGIDPKILDPVRTWRSPELFNSYQQKLYQACKQNYQSHYSGLDLKLLQES